MTVKAPALSAAAWDALLARLGADPGAVGDEYERLRARTVRFLEWHRCLNPEDTADVVLTRLAIKCEQGEPIANVHGYALGIARFVLQEASAIRPVASLDANDGPSPAVAGESQNEAVERRAACLDGCLEQLPKASRELVLRYYEGEGHAKIVQRRNLAASLAITERALRLRVFRVRESLHQCVHQCVGARQRIRPTTRSGPALHS
jgi:DNA-directed RNA polymerase specialized sigma24 family protein